MSVVMCWTRSRVTVHPVVLMVNLPASQYATQLLCSKGVKTGLQITVLNYLA